MQAALRRVIDDPQRLRDICGTEGQLCGQCPFGAYLPSGFPYASEQQALCLPWIVIVHPQPTASPSEPASQESRRWAGLSGSFCRANRPAPRIPLITRLTAP